MKLFRLSIMLMLPICLFATVRAQGKKAKVSPQTKSCQSSQISFPCPKDFQIKNDGKSNGIFVAVSPANDFGIFAFSPGKSFDENNLSDESLKNTLQNLYSTKLEDYRWKNSDDFTDDNTWSKYEISKSAKVGFNKNRGHVIHMQFVRLSFKKKDMVAGYIYELANNSGAEAMYNDWSGGGFMPASYGLQELIIKMTGEKKPSETPGGPPPAAVAKLN